jgi:Kef-type K+ transport system membrane component KefB
VAAIGSPAPGDVNNLTLVRGPTEDVGTEPGDGNAARARLVSLGLVLVAAVALPLLILAGDDLEPQPEIAGRYAVSAGASCLGPDVDVQQSGSFVRVTRPDGAKISDSRLEGLELAGQIDCLDGKPVDWEAAVSDGAIEGTVGGGRVQAVRVQTADGASGGSVTDPDDVDGEYVLLPESVCLGREITIEGGDMPTLTPADGDTGKLIYENGELSGEASCLDGDAVTIRGVPVGDRLEIEIERSAPGEGEQVIEQALAEENRPFGEQTAAFFLAAFVILIVARLTGAGAVALGQPRVMGEILAGILLGPSLLGELAPELSADLFSESVLKNLGVVANLGVAFYIFTVGAELDFGKLRGRSSQIMLVASATLVVPLILGTASALLLFERLAPDTSYASFALFMGVALSITAFPVLARILEDRGMIGGTIGVAALACAAIDDLAGWLLVTLAATLAVAGTTRELGPTLLLTAGFFAAIVFVLRPLLAWLGRWYDRVPDDPAVVPNKTGLIGFVYAGVLLAAFVTEEIGIALIIGALAQGVALPRGAQLTQDAAARLETPVTVMLLPLFFAFAGLRADVGLLGDAELWLIAAALLLLAVLGKFVAGAAAARLAGFTPRDSLVLGTLLNTRGLTELIILTIGLETGVISQALYTALVLMTLVTTFMAGPLLRLLQGPRPAPAPA